MSQLESTQLDLYNNFSLFSQRLDFKQWQQNNINRKDLDYNIWLKQVTRSNLRREGFDTAVLHLACSSKSDAKDLDNNINGEVYKIQGFFDTIAENLESTVCRLDKLVKLDTRFKIPNFQSNLIDLINKTEEDLNSFTNHQDAELNQGNLQKDLAESQTKYSEATVTYGNLFTNNNKAKEKDRELILDEDGSLLEKIIKLDSQEDTNQTIDQPFLDNITNMFVHSLRDFQTFYERFIIYLKASDNGTQECSRENLLSNDGAFTKISKLLKQAKNILQS